MTIPRGSEPGGRARVVPEADEELILTLEGRALHRVNQPALPPRIDTEPGSGTAEPRDPRLQPTDPGASISLPRPGDSVTTTRLLRALPSGPTNLECLRRLSIESEALASGRIAPREAIEGSDQTYVSRAHPGQGHRQRRDGARGGRPGCVRRHGGEEHQGFLRRLLKKRCAHAFILPRQEPARPREHVPRALVPSQLGGGTVGFVFSCSAWRRTSAEAKGPTRRRWRCGRRRLDVEKTLRGSRPFV